CRLGRVTLRVELLQGHLHPGLLGLIDGELDAADDVQAQVGVVPRLRADVGDGIGGTTRRRRLVPTAAAAGGQYQRRRANQSNEAPRGPPDTGHAHPPSWDGSAGCTAGRPRLYPAWATPIPSWPGAPR